MSRLLEFQSINWFNVLLQSWGKVIITYTCTWNKRIGLSGGWSFAWWACLRVVCGDSGTHLTVLSASYAFTSCCTSVVVFISVAILACSACIPVRTFIAVWGAGCNKTPWNSGMNIGWGKNRKKTMTVKRSKYKTWFIVRYNNDNSNSNITDYIEIEN